MGTTATASCTCTTLDACDACMVATITAHAHHRYSDATRITVERVTRIRRGIRAWRITVERLWLATYSYTFQA